MGSNSSILNYFNKIPDEVKIITNDVESFKPYQKNIPSKKNTHIKKYQPIPCRRNWV